MKLVKILPDKIQIKTDDAEFKNARLNDLISVSDGEVIAWQFFSKPCERE